MTVVLYYNYLQDIKYCSKSTNRFVRKSNGNKLHNHFTIRNYHISTKQLTYCISHLLIYRVISNISIY